MVAQQQSGQEREYVVEVTLRFSTRATAEETITDVEDYARELVRDAEFSDHDARPAEVLNVTVRPA